MRILISITLISFLSNLSFAQEDHQEHDHDHHKNELGVANSPVYFIQDKEWAYGLHIHYVRNISHTNFGIGLGFERIYDDHQHKTIGTVFSYRLNRLVLNASPGVTFEERNKGEYNFALHLEGSYEFEFKNFHIGPSFEYAYDTEDTHTSIGLHIGYGF